MKGTLAAVLVAIACICPATAHAWVTAWQAPTNGGSGIYFQTAPDPIRASYPQGFTDQTIRLIITPHATGTHARVVLSNLYGITPLRIAAATIAARANGAALTGPVVPLTFSGRRAVTIPAGAELLSDAAAIAVKPFADLAVSLAFDGPTGPPTNHVNGLQNSFVTSVGSGDLTAAGEPAAFTASTPMRFFLTAVQVDAPAPARTLVAVGDSIVDGGVYHADTADKNARWPDDLQRRLLADGSRISVANAGISANQVTNDESVIPGGGPSLEHRLDRDVLSQPGLAGVIVAEGINDLQITRTPPATVIAGLTRVIERIRAKGLPVFIATLTPAKGDVFDAPGLERARATVNAWIRGQILATGVIDYDAAVRDPADPDRLRVDLDSGDHLHPNAEGLREMAKAIDLVRLRGALGDLPPPPAMPAVKVRRLGCTTARVVLTHIAGAQVRLRLGRRTVSRTARSPTQRLTVHRIARARLIIRITITMPGGRSVVLTRRLARCGSGS